MAKTGVRLRREKNQLTGTWCKINDVQPISFPQVIWRSLFQPFLFEFGVKLQQKMFIDSHVFDLSYSRVDFMI